MNEMSFNLSSSDWGEKSNHLMAKAFGLKKDRKAKCKSCQFHNKGNCSFMSNEYLIDKNYRACSRYKSKKQLKSEGLSDVNGKIRK